MDGAAAACGAGAWARVLRGPVRWWASEGSSARFGCSRSLPGFDFDRAALALVGSGGLI